MPARSEVHDIPGNAAISPEDRLARTRAVYQPFHAALQGRRPDLAGLRFATFGLGDSFYETFNRGSRIIADALVELGAQQVGEHGQHDASSGELPGDAALAWAKGLLGQI